MSDATLADGRAILLRAMSQELGPSREQVIETAIQRLEFALDRAASRLLTTVQ